LFDLIFDTACCHAQPKLAWSLQPNWNDPIRIRAKCILFCSESTHVTKSRCLSRIWSEQRKDALTSTVKHILVQDKRSTSSWQPSPNDRAVMMWRSTDVRGMTSRVVLKVVTLNITRDRIYDSFSSEKMFACWCTFAFGDMSSQKMFNENVVPQSIICFF